MTEGSPWRVQVSRGAEKELKQLASKDQARVMAAIDALAAGPAYGDIKKLHGKENEWRLRVGVGECAFDPTSTIG